MLMVGQEPRSPPIEIDVGRDILAVAFSANGKHLVSGGSDGIQVYRVKDGEKIASIMKRSVRCLTASKDGKWIAAVIGPGSWFIVWDATTYKKVFVSPEYSAFISGVDFSPDSPTRLVTAYSRSIAIVWDVALGKEVEPRLDHTGIVTTVKYSLHGDRIATATQESVRVWDSKDGRFLMNIPVAVILFRNTGLLWFSDNHIFVISDGTIKEFEASSGSAVSEWPVSDTKHLSCIALPKYGDFVAHSTKNTITFWDMSMHTQLALIQCPHNIHSIAFSPDDQFLAIGNEDGKVVMKSLSYVTVSSVSLCIRMCLDNFFVPIHNFMIPYTSHFTGTRHPDR